MIKIINLQISLVIRVIIEDQRKEQQQYSKLQMNTRCMQDTTIKYQSLTQRLSRLSSKPKPSSLDNNSQSVCTTKRTFEKGKHTHTRMKTDISNSERKQCTIRNTLPSEKVVSTNVQSCNMFKNRQNKQKFRYQRTQVKSLTRIKRVNRNEVGY